MTLAVDLMIRKLCYLIVIIENQHPGLKSQGFLPVHHGIGDNDHLITFCTSRAAAPLTQITPLFRSPTIV